MVSIWLVLVIGLVLLAAAIILISPVTMDVQYTYRSENNSQPDQTLKLATPGTGLVLTLLWGLFKIRIGLTTASLGHRALQPVLKLGALLMEPSGSTLAAEKTSLTPGQILGLYRQAVGLYRAFAPVQNYLLGCTTLRRWSWHTGLGLEDAHHTGLAVGALWALKSNFTARIYRLLKRKVAAPDLVVTPFFDHNPAFWMRINCIFTLRLGHIIYAGLLTGWLCLKNCRKVWGY